MWQPTGLTHEPSPRQLPTDHDHDGEPRARSANIRVINRRSATSTAALSAPESREETEIPFPGLDRSSHIRSASHRDASGRHFSSSGWVFLSHRATSAFRRSVRDLHPSVGAQALSGAVGAIAFGRPPGGAQFRLGSPCSAGTGLRTITSYVCGTRVCTGSNSSARGGEKFSGHSALNSQRIRNCIGVGGGLTRRTLTSTSAPAARNAWTSGAR